VILRALLRLLLGLVLSWLAWLALRALRRGDGAMRGARARDIGSRHPQSMVRDRVCNTFLLRSSALSLRRGAEEHFFCSEDCRASFLAGQGHAGVL
jgi:hypothetical protein